MVTHLILSPVRETCDGKWRIYAPGEHSAWQIAAASKTGEIQAGQAPADALEDVLATILEAYPEADGRVSVRWIDEAGNRRESDPDSLMGSIDRLMEVVCDEPPEDAENTDDHPLEELRTVLLDTHDRIERGAGFMLG